MSCHVVATLGPQGTCSQIVLLQNLSRFRRPVTVELCASYELAARAVRDGTANSLFVAAAYPALNVLVFDPAQKLCIVDCFVTDTPVLVVATGIPHLTRPQTIAAVEAPVPVVRATFPEAMIVRASSNADAALLAARGVADAGFTTALAAQQAGLRVIHSFGSVPMAWLLLVEPSSVGNSPLAH